MSTAPASLLTASARAPEFSLTAPDEIFHESEAGGDHTAARLFVRRPAAYSAIVGLSAEGVGVLRAAALLAVSPHTVMAVRRREGAVIEQQRQELAERFRSGAQVAAEAAFDAVADPAQRRKCNVLQLATAAAILTDKAELLSGQAQTIRIEVEHRASPDQFNAMLDEARRKMDLGGETDRTKGATVRDLAAGSVEVGPAPGASDPEQVNIDDVVARVVTATAATCAAGDASGDACAGSDPDAGMGSGAVVDGGGGGRACDGGGVS